MDAVDAVTKALVRGVGRGVIRGFGHGVFTTCEGGRGGRAKGVSYKPNGWDCVAAWYMTVAKADGYKVSEYLGEKRSRRFRLNISPDGQLFVISHKDLNSGVEKHVFVQKGACMFSDCAPWTIRLTTVQGQTRTIELPEFGDYLRYKSYLSTGKPLRV